MYIPHTQCIYVLNACRSQCWYKLLIDLNAVQIGVGLDELVVVVQQDWSVNDGRKPQGWYPQLPQEACVRGSSQHTTVYLEISSKD